MKLKKERILSPFFQDESFLNYTNRAAKNFGGNMMDEKRMSFSQEQATLSVVVGESGIGKTTEICHYVKKLREIGHPVAFISLNDKYNFEKFLEKVFGCSDENLILETLNENFTKKGKIAMFIIDNIHYAQVNGKIDPGLLTFLNGQFYQNLEMSVIMLASVNNAAYEIQNCNFFH